MDATVEIGGKKYKLNKINAMIQFHIVRRVGPLVADSFGVMGKIAKTKTAGLSQEKQLEQFAKMAEPIMKGLSKLSDEDSEYVLYRLLAAVEIHQPEHNIWARVASSDSGMQFDLDLPVMMQLAVKSFMFNLKGFFSLLPQRGSGA